MMRVAGLGAVRLAVPIVWTAAALMGCAPPPAALDETTPRQHEVVSKEEVTNVSTASPVAGADVLLIRELKIIDDNGQQGVFAKLSRPPQNLSHTMLSNPNRLMIEMTGPMGQNIIAERYAVNNPMVEQVQVGSDEGKIRVTLLLKGDTPPTYTVDTLSFSVSTV